jgi:hypothetical protein
VIGDLLLGAGVKVGGIGGRNEEKEKFMTLFPWVIKLLHRRWWKRKFERMASPLGAH